MKVLWFEISEPARYSVSVKVTNGWQDALESCLASISDIELYVAFESKTAYEIKVIDGITYIPININYSWFEKKVSDFTWNVNSKKLIPACIDIIDKYVPDIIHIFGNEWPFGLIASRVSIPIVIHIQGSIIPYDNALYPPKYSHLTLVKETGLNPIKQYRLIKKFFKDRSRLTMEREIWKVVNNYMGRTIWDLSLSKILSPKSKYWHVDEALRPVFLNSKLKWNYQKREKHVLFTTGISSFWKGPDMLLKTAHVLKQVGFNFEWQVAGFIGDDLKKIIEKKENLLFAENNISILGFINAEQLLDFLSRASLYVHTAYIENSPNSICEAQFLGLPVVATMVGGVDTLVQNYVEGELVPANDPWRMAYTIMQLIDDEDRLNFYSKNSRLKAERRHNPSNVVTQLLDCYNDLISNK